jgi:hypothetical protein
MNFYAIGLGKLLLMIKETKEWKEFGNDVEYWNQFLDHIGMTVSEASKYISLFQFLAKKGGTIPKISPSKLKKAIKYHKFSDMDLDSWISLAENGPGRDFNDEINKIKGKKSYLECNHEETETLKRCTICGKWQKEHTEPIGHSMVQES